ncbi:hypothetical protein L1987_35435 [Smallanthus sonchifolius]|uniref:Uncharacterized protein n=1 Tax=Smallanthus sonchifolius TaxID=185202 RepID=A0ACB9HY16_9ASTR|nr:hypothetical protein L1987_35435 [Smallanthus sonchifolius]
MILIVLVCIFEPVPSAGSIIREVFKKFSFRKESGNLWESLSLSRKYEKKATLKILNKITYYSEGLLESLMFSRVQKIQTGFSEWGDMEAKDEGTGERQRFKKQNVACLP